MRSPPLGLTPWTSTILRTSLAPPSPSSPQRTRCRPGRPRTRPGSLGHHPQRSVAPDSQVIAAVGRRDAQSCRSSRRRRAAARPNRSAAGTHNRPTRRILRGAGAPGALSPGRCAIRSGPRSTRNHPDRRVAQLSLLIGVEPAHVAAASTAEQVDLVPAPPFGSDLVRCHRASRKACHPPPSTAPAIGICPGQLLARSVTEVPPRPSPRGLKPANRVRKPVGGSAPGAADTGHHAAPSQFVATPMAC
jgi:hypothetical protein